ARRGATWAMARAEVLAGVRLKTPLPRERARVEVAGIEYDSGRAGEGYLFFAFPGSKADGRKFAADALGRGAIASASEAEAPPDLAHRWIRLEHGRRSLAVAARNYYGRLDEQLVLIGITGTNGKTTTSY